MAERKAVTPLVLENEETGEKIIFEYDRDMILQMDAEGISGANIGDKLRDMPVSTMVKLVYYGMLIHQPDTTLEDATNLVFEAIGMDHEFLERLGELFSEPYNALMEASLKNGKWRVKK